jgi:putative transposase
MPALQMVVSPADAQRVSELVRPACEKGLSLTGPDGLLKQLTKVMIETALDQEMTEHLGYERTPRPATRPGMPSRPAAPFIC